MNQGAEGFGRFADVRLGRDGGDEGDVACALGKDFFDVFKDPREEHGVMGAMLWAWVPFDDIARMHNDLIKKYPHRKPYRSVIKE